MRGRLQFAEAQISGRAAGNASKQLTRHVVAGGSALTDETLAALLILRDRVMHQRTPAQHDAHLCRSCDSDKAGLGGVLVHGSGSILSCFSEFASPWVRGKVNPASCNPIFEYESLVILMALDAWAPLIHGTNLVIFTDNEGTLACVITGTSENKFGARFAQLVHERCDSLGCNVWFERVNTTANIADAPSRGAPLDQLGNRVAVDVDSLVSHACETWGV